MGDDMNIWHDDDDFISVREDNANDGDFERLADHIAKGETDDALALLEKISGGVVSASVTKMLVVARAQESLL